MPHINRVICIVLFAFISIPTVAEARTKNPVPTKGVYLYCKDLAYCQPHIDRLINVGVHIFITPPYKDAQAIHDYIAAKGGNIYWNVSIIGRDEAIAKVAPWNATAGFYIADEPALWGRGGEVQLWHNRVRELSNSKPTLIVHWGCTKQAVKAAVIPYITAAEMHGTDCYPLTTGGKAERWLRPSLLRPWTEMTRIAIKRQQLPVAVGKAFSWTDVPEEAASMKDDHFPSWSEFHTMTSAARKAGIKLLIWWGYDVWKDRLDAEARWAAFNGAFA